MVKLQKMLKDLDKRLKRLVQIVVMIKEEINEKSSR